jgi:anti-sigma factor RsiW
MNQQSAYQQLLEQSWRRPLTPAEQAQLRAWLEAHPECRRDWELEAGLNEALRRLPEPPVSNNFTARVLQAAQREAAAGTAAPWRSPGRWVATLRDRWSPLRWLPGTALAALLVAAGLFSYQRYNHNRHSAMVQSLATVAEIRSLPSPTILKDFDAILALDDAPRADEELLALFQ